MNLRMAWTSLVVLGVAAGSVPAQQPGSTVQLPTFSFFSVNTTVSVPDRGSVYMGGIKRAASGRNEFGVPMLPFRPFKNTAIGSQMSASNVHVTATIHDFAAMDEFLLGQPTSSRSLASRQPRSALATLGHTLQPRSPIYGRSWQTSSPASSNSRPMMSVAEAQARRLSQQATRGEEADDFFQRGQKAEAAGKANVAKIYYQMAARRATGELKGRITARLEAIGSAQAVSQIAQSRP